MQYEIRMDGTDFTVVAICPCGWRHFTFVRSDGWHAAARHLKTAHGDLYAARHATNNATSAESRERKAALTSAGTQSPHDLLHGITGHTEPAGERATADT